MNPMQALHSSAGQAKGMRMGVGGPTSKQPGDAFRRQEAFNYINPGHGSQGKQFFKYGRLSSSQKKQARDVLGRNLTANEKAILGTVVEEATAYGTPIKGQFTQALNRIQKKNANVIGTDSTGHGPQGRLHNVRQEKWGLGSSTPYSVNKSQSATWNQGREGRSAAMAFKKAWPKGKGKPFAQGMSSPWAPIQGPVWIPHTSKKSGAKLADQAESNRLKKGPDQKLGVPGKSRGFFSAAADSFSGMKWKGKAMMAGAGAVAGGIAWNRMGESKNSPIGAGVSTAALTAAGLAGMKYGAGAAVKPLMKSGRIGSAKTAANLAMRANRIGIGKGAAIAGGGIAALGAIRNMTGI